MIKKRQSLAVHLHLYYIDMWPEIKRLLSNMGDYPYDLFVTMTSKNAKIEKDIKDFHRNTQIMLIENRGYDIGPFIDFLHNIDLNKYDFIMKLHTKNVNEGVNTHINQYVLSRKLWFKTLTRALIGSPHIFNKNISKLTKNPDLGMIGSKYLITSDPKCSKYMQPKIDNVLDKLGYHSAPVTFVAGTMFICRSKILTPFKEHYSIQDFAPTDGTIKDGTLSHVLERVLGSVTVADGYKLEGYDWSLPYTYQLNLKNISRFIYQHKITSSKHELVKIFKLPVYHRRVL